MFSTLENTHMHTTTVYRKGRHWEAACYSCTFAVAVFIGGTRTDDEAFDYAQSLAEQHEIETAENIC